MSHHWYLIEKWLDRKIHEFTVQEKINPCLTKEQWLDRYLYTKIHEIFFCTFLIEPYEWNTKLADDQGRWRLDSPIVWILELVWRLEAYDDNIMRAVDHWLDRVKGGFVIEFAVDTSVTYSEEECHFFKCLVFEVSASFNIA